MASLDQLGIPNNWEEGITVCLVVKSSDAGNPQVLQLLGGEPAPSAAELAFTGDHYSGGVRLSKGDPGFSEVMTAPAV